MPKASTAILAAPRVSPHSSLFKASGASLSPFFATPSHSSLSLSHRARTAKERAPFFRLRCRRHLLRVPMKLFLCYPCHVMFQPSRSISPKLIELFVHRSYRNWVSSPSPAERVNFTTATSPVRPFPIHSSHSTSSTPLSFPEFSLRHLLLRSSSLRQPHRYRCCPSSLATLSSPSSSLSILVSSSSLIATHASTN